MVGGQSCRASNTSDDEGLDRVHLGVIAIRTSVFLRPLPLGITRSTASRASETHWIRERGFRKGWCLLSRERCTTESAADIPRGARQPRPIAASRSNPSYLDPRPMGHFKIGTPVPAEQVRRLGDAGCSDHRAHAAAARAIVRRTRERPKPPLFRRGILSAAVAGPSRVFNLLRSIRIGVSCSLSPRQQNAAPAIIVLPAATRQLLLPPSLHAGIRRPTAARRSGQPPAQTIPPLGNLERRRSTQLSLPGRLPSSDCAITKMSAEEPTAVRQP